MPASLQGTDIDGGLDVDATGHLALGPRVLQLFDYFFSASGEESDAVIRARIEGHARAHLREPALTEALALVDHYMAYREAGRSLRVADGASASERLAAVRKLRQAHFGDAARALFGDDEREGEVAIAKSEIAKDKALSADERADKLSEAEEALSEADKLARSRAGSVTQLRADEEALRAAGAGEDEIHRFRKGTLGEDAASRLDALDRERAAWKARLEAFQQERDKRCGAGATACETALLEASFDERERIRVRAILSTPPN